MSEEISKEELLAEFVSLYNSPSATPPKDTEAIVILTGAPRPKEENLSRIRRGLEVLYTLDRAVPVVYSGTTEERAEMLEQMRQIGVPKPLRHFQDCGTDSVANTKTQFETLISDPLTKSLKVLVLVTSTYHIPRVKRTAGRFLPPETQFVVIGDPNDWKILNPLLQTMGEIDRIMKYSAKGDILHRPR